MTPREAGSSTTSSTLEALVSRLYDGLVNVEKNQERTTTVLEGLVASLQDVRKNLSEIERTVHDRAKTQWGVIFGSVTVAFTLLAFFGGLVVYAYSGDLGDIDEQVGGLSEKIHQHQANGHPNTVIEQLEGLRRENDKRETSVERHLGRIQERLRDLEKRTGTLFKEGKPY